MKTIKARKLADDFIVVDPVILEENSKFRRQFCGQLAKDAFGNWNVRGALIAERMGPNGWQPVEATRIADLKAGELAKFELKTEHMKRLLTGLQVLTDAAADKGITLHSTDLIVGRKEEIVRVVERNHKGVIEQLIAQNRGNDFWTLLTSLEPDIASQLADASVQNKRKKALSTFELELGNGKWKEPDWEHFFAENQWIFGYGLRYQFLGLLQNQASYGGTNYTGKGNQKGEFLLKTEAEWERFTVTVEIKRPESSIFDSAADVRPYRSGVPGFSTEFVNAISQVQTNSRTWETEGSRREDDQEMLSRQGIHTVSPRSILIFGNTQQLSTPSKVRSFQLFRTHLSGTDILTFDEVLARARFIVREGNERGI
jgi:hypothetical protein